MRYLYLTLAALVSLGLLYSLFGIGYLKLAYHRVENPKANFLVINNEASNLTIVDFVNYRCGFCKQAHPLIVEALKLHKDVRYIAKPILLPNKDEEGYTQEPAELEKLAMAAGLQGKFEEMHNTFLEYPDGIIPEEIIKETALLYGIDYDQMVKDSQSKKVQKYLDDNMRDLLSMNIQTIPSYVIGQNIYVISDKMPDLKQLLTIITNEKK